MADQRPQVPSRFHRRLNKDGTTDSICSNCFRTVATEKSETQLVDREQSHICHDSVVMRKQSLGLFVVSPEQVEASARAVISDNPNIGH